MGVAFTTCPKPDALVAVRVRTDAPVRPTAGAFNSFRPAASDEDLSRIHERSPSSALERQMSKSESEFHIAGTQEGLSC